MMITLANIRDLIASFHIADNHYIGKLDDNKEKSIGVYSLKRTGSPIIALGGLENTTYNTKPVSVLIHWNKNADETERTAQHLFDKLLEIKNYQIGDTEIHFIKMNVPDPVDVGTDDKGVYERVIEFEVYYQRSE